MADIAVLEEAMMLFFLKTGLLTSARGYGAEFRVSYGNVRSNPSETSTYLALPAGVFSPFGRRDVATGVVRPSSS